MTIRVRIYRPCKTSMQSGTGRTARWVVEPELPSRREPDPLMGWQSARDTLNQVRLSFDSREQAIDYARRNGLSYQVEEPRRRRIRPKAYADNFAYDRVGQWTH